MEMTTTRIADLPENMTMSQDTPTNYTTMNIHPNPYGHPPQNPTFMPNPQQTSTPRANSTYPMPPISQLATPQSQYLDEEQQAYIRQMKPQRLPSRDIPHDTTEYTQDEHIQPNYIPAPKTIHDYVREQENTTEKNAKEYETKKRRENRFQTLVTEFQIPILVALLFFVFQMPIVNMLLFKRFLFLSIYHEDGHFNFQGLLFKSALFGSAFYTLLHGIHLLSEI
jgi:hypothetical protein